MTTADESPAPPDSPLPAPPDSPPLADGVPPLAAGRDADVYPLDDERWVLRRYRAGGEVAAEAAVMRYVRAHGYPVPEVSVARGADLVLERLDGPTMLVSLLAGTVTPAAAGALLADLHTRLHALPPRRPDRPEARILHLDLHPDNVMLTRAGPVVIDWRSAVDGPPDFDLAMTALILAEAAAGSYLPAEHVPAARELLRAFLAGAGGDPVGHLDQAHARRSADPNLTATEIGRLAAAAGLVRTDAGS